MKRIRQFLTILIPVLLLASLVPLPVSASENTITVPFLSMGKTLTWEFPYSDDYFTSDSDLFSFDLAKASFGLTVSAFRNDGFDLPDQYETYLEEAGFTDISSFGYDEPTSIDSLSGVIAQKKIGNHTLIAAVPCGQGYGKEWASNMTVGDGDVHEGFSKAANLFEEKILSYIEEHKIDGAKKLWLSGFSRASAVSNITAARMIDSGLFEDVYAYLFAVPRTTKTPKDASGTIYYGIYNICGKYDPVTQIPLESWGFDRYGLDFYTPAQENDATYAQKAGNAAGTYAELTGTPFYNNPEVNHQLHMIIEFMGEMFPDNEEYVLKFQDHLVNVMQEQNMDNILLLLTKAVEQMDDLNRREEYSSDILINYLSYMMSQHLGEKDKQAEEGRWDRTASVTENLMREHLPAIYLTWLFSNDDPEKIFTGDTVSRTISIQADADVEVYLNGKLIGTASRDGTIKNELDLHDWTGYDHETFFDELNNVCLIRNGIYTDVIVPEETSYEIVLRTYDDTDVVYYQVLRAPYFTLGASDDMGIFGATEGEYHLNVIGSDAIPQEEFRAVSGNMTPTQHFAYPYSPVRQMAEESGATNFISLQDLLMIVLWFTVFVVLLLLVCLVIFIIHSRGKRKYGKTYSDWYVIVPHLILIVLFTLMSRFFSVNMFAIGIVRQACATAGMLLIFLLALRGALRYRNAWSISVSAFLLILTVVNFFFYQRSENFSGSAGNFIIYTVISLVLMLLALSTFFVRKKPRS